MQVAEIIVTGPAFSSIGCYLVQRKLDELPSQLDHELIVDHVMKSTGLPREMIEGLNLTDEELDDLCDTVLTELGSPWKKVIWPGR